jgi:hypothetical protein
VIAATRHLTWRHGYIVESTEVVDPNEMRVLESRPPRAHADCFDDGIEMRQLPHLRLSVFFSCLGVTTSASANSVAPQSGWNFGDDDQELVVVLAEATSAVTATPRTAAAFSAASIWARSH